MLDRTIGIGVATATAAKYDCAFLMLGNGEFTLIDKQDEKECSRYLWCIGDKGYALRTVKGRNLYLHGFLMSPGPGQTVDHRSGVRLDNRRENLRLCTLAQNRLNSPRRSDNKASKYKGVRKSKTPGKFEARIGIAGKQFQIGTYYTEDQAAEAYNEMARRIFKEFAMVNVIQKS